MVKYPPTLRRFLTTIGLLAGGALAGAGATYLFLANRGPGPEPWHRLHPAGELTADRAAEVPDLAAYRRLETRLFAGASAELARRVKRWPAFSRFDPEGPTHPSRFDRDWNRTYELAPIGAVRGEALLLHGLSDSPGEFLGVTSAGGPLGLLRPADVQ